MASPKHKCAKEGCEKMISARATYCRNHFPRTKQHIENQANAQRGRKCSPIACQKMSEARRKRAKKVGNALIETKCQLCGKRFKIKPYRLKAGEGKFCSSKCQYKAVSGENSIFWNGGVTEYHCAQCGTLIRKHSCHKQGENVFCCYSCRSIYYKAKQNNKNTDIEQIMKKALLGLDMIFKEQIALCNISVADFFIPKKNLVIFCDGDYWHNFPIGKTRDKQQTQILEHAGFNVLRFWGSEIKEDLDRCLEEIRGYL